MKHQSFSIIAAFWICLVALDSTTVQAQHIVVQTASPHSSNDEPATTVRGSVCDESGAGISGATVGLYNYYPMSRSPNVMKPTPYKTAVTDAGGSFTLTSDNQLGRTLVVHADGFLDDIDDFRQDSNVQRRLAESRGTSVTVTRKITLQKQSHLKGIVADANGKILPGATVQAYPAIVVGNNYSQPLETDMTDGDGVFHFNAVPLADVCLRVSADGYATKYVTVKNGQEPAINLTRGAEVSGSARFFDTGKPAGKARITLSAKQDRRNSMNNEQVPHPYPHQWTESAISGASGRFAFRNVPPGEYNMAINANQGEAQMNVWSPGAQNRMAVTVGEDEAPLVVELPIYDGYTISGVVAEEGTTTPVKNATVWNMNTYPNTSTVADANGAYRFEHIFGGNDIRLAATAPGFHMARSEIYGSNTNTTHTISVSMPSTTTQVRANIPMEREILVTGTVLDAVTSRPVSGATVSSEKNYYQPNNSGSQKYTTTSGPDGKFSVYAQPGEIVRLRVAANGFAPKISDVIRPAEKKEIELLMTKGASISGVVKGPNGEPMADATIGHRFSITGVRESSGNSNSYSEAGSTKATSDAAGEFTLPNLPVDGRIELVARKTGSANSEQQSFTPTAGDRITSVILNLREPKHLSGHVLDSNGKPAAHVIVNANSQNTNGHAFARTEDDGAYRLSDLPDAPVDVSIMGHLGNEWFYDIEVGRDDVDFQFGKGDKNGMHRMDHDRKKKAEKEGIPLYGKVVDYATGKPVTNFSVTASEYIKAESIKDEPGAFKATGVLVQYPYQWIRIKADGYALYDSGQLAIPAGKTEVHRTFKLGPGGSIVGRAVIKGTEKPVPGVIVSLVNNPTVYLEPASGDKVEPSVTDDEGKFKLTGLGIGRKTISFEPPPGTNYVKMTQIVDVIYNEESDVGDVEFGAGGTIKGRLIRTPGDKPIPNAQITLRGGKSTSTDSDGNFEFTNLVNGLYYAQAPQYGANSWVGVDQLETKELILEVGTGKLAATVLRAGKPYSCRVHLTKVGFGQSVMRYGNSDSSGKFTVNDLAPGNWKVELTSTDNRTISMIESVVMPASGESVEKTFNFPSSELKITVVDAAGKAIPSADVLIRKQSGADAVLQAEKMMKNTNNNGQANFEGLEPGTYAATAKTSDDQRGEKGGIQVSDAQSAAATITLEPADGGTLVSTALDLKTGKPVPTAWCYLWNENGQLFEHSGKRDELGMVTIPNIPPGNYRVQVSAFGFSVNERQVTITGGQSTEINDVLYEAGALRWALRDSTGAPVVGASCTLTPVDADSIEEPRSGKSDANGVYSARGLLPGAYIGKANGPGGIKASASVTVYAHNATDEVTLMQ